MTNMVLEYGLTDDQKDLQQMVREFVAKELTWEKMREFDERSEIPMEAYKKAADMGLTTLLIPEKFGGQGLGQVELAIMGEELGYGPAGGFAATVLANTLAYEPIEKYGNDDQKARYAKFLVDGGFAAFALTEANAGSDVGALTTTAVKEGDEYVINGTKAFITNGGVANVYTLFAVTTPNAGHSGLSCFMVERDRPGVSIGTKEDKIGIRTSDTSEVYFDNVRIPASNLIGEENKGFKMAMTIFDCTRPAAVAAGCVGGMRFLIDQCLDYARTRVTFGQEILNHQEIQFKLARMEMLAHVARATVYRAAEMLDQGLVDTAISSAAKVFASDTLMESAIEAIQIFGGNGYSNEYPINAIFRDAKIFQIFEGTNEICHLTVIRAMVKDAIMSGR